MWFFWLVLVLYCKVQFFGGGQIYCFGFEVDGDVIDFVGIFEGVEFVQNVFQYFVGCVVQWIVVVVVVWVVIGYYVIGVD